jgi:magnesium-protoporphyrin IX monomethyl ester (oxidative) cyclase
MKLRSISGSNLASRSCQPNRVCGLKVLLVNPSNQLQTLYFYRKVLVPAIPPANLASLAAMAQKHGHETDIYDQFLEQTSTDTLCAMILAGKYDVVGISCLTPSDSIIRKLGCALRLANPKIRIVLGNTHAGFFAEDFLSDNTFDAVVHGEGEQTFVHLLDAFSTHEPLSQVPGISYVNDGAVLRTSARPLIKNLDDLPFPAWDKVDLSRYVYHPSLFIYGQSPLPIQASRGCTHRCYMCTQDALLRTFRKRSVDSVLDEIDRFKQSHNIRTFVFLDSYFPPDLEWGWEFVERVNTRFGGRHFDFQIESRTDTVDPDLFEALVKIGCTHVMLGYECGTDESLKRIGKGANIAHGKAAMAVLKRLNVITTGFFMIGFPWETEPMIQQTIRYALALSPDLLKFNIATPFPGSRFYEDIKNQTGENLDFDRLTAWTDYIKSNATEKSPLLGLARKTLSNLQVKGMLQHYLRPSILWRHFKLGSFRLENAITFAAGIALLIKKRLFKGAKS